MAKRKNKMEEMESEPVLRSGLVRNQHKTMSRLNALKKLKRKTIQKLCKSKGFEYQGAAMNFLEQNISLESHSQVF